MAKKALLVGINDYPGTQNDLYGCVNDITNVYDILVKYFAFVPSDIVLLSNARARKAAILDGLKTLLGGAQGNDRDVARPDDIGRYASGHAECESTPRVRSEHETAELEVKGWDATARMAA